VSLSRIGIWQGFANSLIFGLEGIITIWLAARLLIGGGFSTGMVFAFLAYKSQFTQKAASLIDQAVAYKMLGLHLERLSDIALAEQDPSFERPVARTTQLRGKLELRDVSFRYSSADPLLLDKVNLVIEPGEQLLITGPSGGGKSTLVKIILGLIEPSGGTVLVDDLPLSQFGYKQFHAQLGAVLQDDHLFAGSLAENIALFDEMPDMRRIMKSAELAALHDEIDLMPLGYETLVGDMGSALSGGQRQRLLLARAFYRAPRLLVVDEATANLDRAREEAVISAIAGMGMTRIVVTHRTATIRAAPRIIEVRNGALVDISEDVRSRPAEDMRREQGSLRIDIASTSEAR
jgi:ATP-binding cassette subfamily B protein RaxB